VARFKTRVFGVAIVLLAAIAAAILLTNSQGGRLKLPTGHGTPAVSVGERHGLILASDGSLWTWGCDFLGWPVLGLSNRVNQTTTLRRIGKDTN